ERPREPRERGRDASGREQPLPPPRHRRHHREGDGRRGGEVPELRVREQVRRLADVDLPDDVRDAEPGENQGGGRANGPPRAGAHDASVAAARDGAGDGDGTAARLAAALRPLASPTGGDATPGATGLALLRSLLRGRAARPLPTACCACPSKLAGALPRERAGRMLAAPPPSPSLWQSPPPGSRCRGARGGCRSPARPPHRSERRSPRV